jgi:hypothetical protein
MKKQYLRILMALVGVAGFGVTAKAQVADQVVVNIPFEFAVNGKTLPAGTYRVNRVSDTDSRALILSSFEKDASVIVLAAQVASSPAEKATLTFEQVGDQRFLSKIQTSDHAFTIPVSRSEILQAEAKSPSGTSASASAAGSN